MSHDTPPSLSPPVSPHSYRSGSRSERSSTVSSNESPDLDLAKRRSTSPTMYVRTNRTPSTVEQRKRARSHSPQSMSRLTRKERSRSYSTLVSKEGSVSSSAAYSSSWKRLPKTPRSRPSRERSLSYKSVEDALLFSSKQDRLQIMQEMRNDIASTFEQLQLEDSFSTD